jgi:hypothetical protein
MVLLVTRICSYILLGEESDERLAIERAVNNFEKDILLKTEETPKLAENSVIALACFAYHLPSSAYFHLEKLVEVYKTWIAKASHEWMLYGSCIGIGLLVFKLQWTDVNRIETIISILTNLLETNSSQSVRMAAATSLGYASIGLFKKENVDDEEEENNTSASDQDKSKVTMVTRIVSVLKKFYEESDNSDNLFGVLGSAAGLGIASSALQNSLEFNAIVQIYESFLTQLKASYLFISRILKI